MTNGKTVKKKSNIVSIDVVIYRVDASLCCSLLLRPEYNQCAQMM